MANLTPTGASARRTARKRAVRCTMASGVGKSVGKGVRKVQGIGAESSACHPVATLSSALEDLGATETRPATASGSRSGRPGAGVHSQTTASPARAEEAQLVARARAGDQRAMRQIYSAYQGQVRGHLYRLLGHDPDIDDLVQTVFARAFTKLDTFKGQAALSTWLYRITANTTHNLLRQRFRRNRVVHAFQKFRTSANSDVQRASTVEARDEAQRVLSLLKPDLQEVFVLYHYEGLTLQEIANILDRPLSTIGDQLSRARRQLKKLVSS